MLSIIKTAKIKIHMIEKRIDSIIWQLNKNAKSSEIVTPTVTPEVWNYEALPTLSNFDAIVCQRFGSLN